MNLYEIIQRPLVTEKGEQKRAEHNTMLFAVATDANKTQIRQAVELLFKVKVDEVRTVAQTGKLRRRGKFSGYRGDWKKAYVKLKAGQKMPEYVEV